MNYPISIANQIFVDLQGFKDQRNKFIVKELSLATAEYTQTYLIKPPFSFSSLTNNEKRSVKWLEKNRGIFWSEGYIDYREFKRVIALVLKNKYIVVKGLEKIKWVKELCNECIVKDIGELPKLSSLHKKYFNNSSSMNCFHHSKECALKNVVCLRNWCSETYIT